MADQDKTQEPTQRKRDDARRKGQVPKSREVTSAMVLGSGVLALSLGGGHMWAGLESIARGCLAGGFDIDLETVPGLAAGWTRAGLMVLAPVLLASTAAALIGGFGQVGVVMSPEAIAPKLERVSPAAGFKRLFSLNAVMELLRGVAKIVALSIVVWLSLRHRVTDIVAVGNGGIATILPQIGVLCFAVMRNCLIFIFLLALADFGYQRWKFTQDLRMTTQEVKEEMKESEGDPLIRSRIRALQREMASKRMMAAVPTADVVVTNPTHFAVALRYQRGEDSAPRVVAKGAGFVAQRIKQIARDAGVMVREDKPLARTLFRTVEVGQFIPEQLYRAVAEVLAYVYRARRESPPATSR